MGDLSVYDELSQHTQTGQLPETTGELLPDQFMQFVEETRLQPAFRSSQDKAADYYDGNQLTAEVLQMLDQQGFSALMTNLIKPTIDTVLGIEAKTRTDFRVTADDDETADVAEALSAKLAEAERESRADRACSDAYGGQVKTGLGWVHVSRNPDPFEYNKKAESVHRREMFWDWSTPISDPLLKTSRYLIREKWFPVEQVAVSLPQHADLLRASGSGWTPDWIQHSQENVRLQNAFDQETRMSVSAWDWRNIDNKRVALHECWYARHIRGLVLDLGTRIVEFDKRNPLHLAAVNSRQITPQPAIFRKLRCSIWYGPHLLVDYDPGTNEMPYVPFWGFREDLTGVPYGLVRSMIPLQDEVNARRRKLMWLLSSKRVQVDSDALDRKYNDFSDLEAEVSRPDTMIVTNPSRTNKDALRIESDLGLAQQQFEILNEAKQGIQEAGGIFNSVMGKTDGAKSGIAVNSLVEQASNTMGELNDNFKFSRQQVGRLLLAMVRQDLSGRQVHVMAGPKEARSKKIFLNTPKIDQLTGIQYKENDVDKASVKVALEDIPSTPAYRAQQMMMMGETIKAMPPQAQAMLVPFYIEATDLPKRHEMANNVRKALGIPVDGEQQQDPMVGQLQQQLQALHQQSQEAMGHYENAVQEQSQKADQLAMTVQQLQGQIKDKAQELQLRQQEIEAKRLDDQANAQKAIQVTLAQEATKQATAQQKLAEAEVRKRELALEEERLALEKDALKLKAGEATAGHTHRMAQLEHQQMTAAAAATPDAAVPPEVAHGHDVDLIKVKGQVERENAIALEREKRITAVEVAELRASATPSTLTADQVDAADGDGKGIEAQPAAAAPAPAKGKAAAAKNVEFVYKDGALVGAKINGKMVATVKRTGN
jgi:hypothetical protein